MHDSFKNFLHGSSLEKESQLKHLGKPYKTNFPKAIGALSIWGLAYIPTWEIGFLYLLIYLSLLSLEKHPFSI